MRKVAIISLAAFGGFALMASRGRFRSLPNLGGAFDFPDFDEFLAAPSAVTAGAGSVAIASPLGGEPSIEQRIAIAQSQLSAPIIITSGLRTVAENIAAGGATASLHLTNRARDISIAGHNLGELYKALQLAGFTGFGFYEAHIHADTGAARSWFGSDRAKTIWGNVAQN